MFEIILVLVFVFEVIFVVEVNIFLFELDFLLDIWVVVGSVVNMWFGLGIGYNKVSILIGGIEVVVFEDSNGWICLKVVEIGCVGWMVICFLSVFEF